MQGLPDFIPTDDKVEYLNQLLAVGFDTIDIGSFVSPKAIPQMADTAEVLSQINWSPQSSKLLVIVANMRGVEDAMKWDCLRYLGFPLSISETFQQRNTNRSISEALEVIQATQLLCEQVDKELVTYISMGFGNPYGDPYDQQTVLEFVQELSDLGITTISLADTVGVAGVEEIQFLFNHLIPTFPHIEFGAHLHANPLQAKLKISSAYQAGCRRFDGALKGFGGCPMAEDELVGNMPTEIIIQYLQSQGVDINLDEAALNQALATVVKIFPAH